MIVDRAVADVAAAEVRNEGLAELVQQRAAKQDGDTRRTGVGVDVDHPGRLHVGWVEAHHAVFAELDQHAVQLKQLANDLNVADGGNIAEHARGIAQQSRNHGLGDQVLGALEVDSPLERLAASDCDLAH